MGAEAKLAVNDKNGDRKLVKSELANAPILLKAFDRFDANKNEELDFNELTEMSKKITLSKTLLGRIEKMLNEKDSDNSGLLSKDEVDGTPFKTNFAKLDTDNDDGLSKFEIAIFMLKRSKESRRPLNGRGRQATNAFRAVSRETTDDDVKRLLKQDDKNKDGKLGKDESPRPNLTRNFASFDSNSDGFLDAAELKKTGLRPFGGAFFLEAFDQDGDKFLSKKEATFRTLANAFSRLDTNEDGKLSKSEMDEIRGGILFRKRTQQKDF